MSRTPVITTLMVALVASCGSTAPVSDSADSAPPPGTETIVTEVAPAESATTDVTTAPASSAPDVSVVDPPTDTGMPFEASFEECLTAAGIAYSDQVASMLTPPTGPGAQMPLLPAEPVAVYGPPDGIWWAVFVAANPQDREFLGWYVPSYTSMLDRGRVLSIRGAIPGWTDDGTLTAAGLAPDEQAQLEPISTCVLDALEQDAAFTAASLPAERPTTVELAGALMRVECEGPDCQVLANEAHFTVPADGAAGALVGTATYTIQFPVADTPGCTNTLTRTITYDGTVDETPEGVTTINGAKFDFWDAFDNGATAPTDPAWPGRVLADGTLHLLRTVSPEGCAEGSELELPLPQPLVGYYAPNEQILSAVWATGVNGSDYLWAIGDM